MDETNKFGAWVRKQRKSRGLTVEEVAKRVGCSVGGVRNIERGQRLASANMAARLVVCVAYKDDEGADVGRNLWLMDRGAHWWREFEQAARGAGADAECKP